MSIDVQQPAPFDLVTNAIQIGGMAGGAFEASYNFRVHEGHDEINGSFMAGDGAGGHGQFQLIADVSGATFRLDRVFIEVVHT
ncbi:MAG: peptigoglycan-binding protein LysM, partial [Aldersonia sp.]|nr:peptigoglycan-binding protein LysM [Aldersonia sp.]